MRHYNITVDNTIPTSLRGSTCMYVCMYVSVSTLLDSLHILRLHSPHPCDGIWTLMMKSESEVKVVIHKYIHTYILLCRTAYSKRKHLWNFCMYVYIYMCNKRLFLITVNSDILDHPCNNHSCSTISTYTHTYIHTYSTYSTHTHI